MDELSKDIFCSFEKNRELIQSTYYDVIVICRNGPHLIKTQTEAKTLKSWKIGFSMHMMPIK